MARKPRTEFAPRRAVTLRCSASPATDSVAYTLATERWEGPRVRSELLVNSTMLVDRSEHTLWTPAQMAFVISNVLVLPGDEIWYTPNLE